MATWMVVEDEPNIYELLMAMFEMWGIAGRAFIDGEEAVTWLNDVDAERFKGDLPELVLLDLRLPGEVQGEEVGKRLRQSAKLKHVPIVIISGDARAPENMAEIRAMMQPDLWLTKPLPKFNQLQSMLEEIIAKKREALAAAVPPPLSIATPSDDLPPPRRRRRKRSS